MTELDLRLVEEEEEDDLGLGLDLEEEPSLPRRLPTLEEMR